MVPYIHTLLRVISSLRKGKVCSEITCELGAAVVFRAHMLMKLPSPRSPTTCTSLLGDLPSRISHLFHPLPSLSPHLIPQYELLARLSLKICLILFVLLMFELKN